MIHATEALSAHCRDSYVEIRLAEGTVLTAMVVRGIWEVIHMCFVRKGKPVRSLVVLPERLNFDLSVVMPNGVNPLAGCVEVQAAVVPDAHLRGLANSQAIACPRPYPYRVFAGEEEATAWLVAQ